MEIHQAKIPEANPILKPMIVEDVRIEIPDLPKKVAVHESKAAGIEAEHGALKAENEEPVLVIKLKWSYVAYAVVGLLFVYMMYQFHSMSSRILILETTLREVRKSV